MLDGLRGVAVVLVLLFHLSRLGGAVWPDRVLASVFGAAAALLARGPRGLAPLAR